MRKNILISAYAISPYKGSEFGAAWNTIAHLSKQHNLWVLYGASDEHMGDTETMKKYLQTNTLPNVTFIEIKPGRVANLINSLNKAGLTWFFYLAFYLWQKKALRVAKKILSHQDIDLIHQLGPIGFREPGFLWRINKPFVWGSIGGTSSADFRLLRHKHWKVKFIYCLKNYLTKYQLKKSKRVKKAILRADALIGARQIDRKNIKEVFGKESFYLSEQGLLKQPTLNKQKFETIYDCINLVWSGRHDENKNLILLLEALGKLKSEKWILNILGTGPLTNRLKTVANRLRMADNIIWHGHLERSEAIEIMSNSHLHIITSIMEGNPAVLLEAVTNCIPTLTLEHCGMADIVCEKCGIKIPVNEHDIVANDIANRLQQLLDNPEVLVGLAQGTMQCSKKYSWDHRLQVLGNVYDTAIANWNNYNSN